MYGVSRALKRASYRAGRTIVITLLMSIAFVLYFEFLSDGNFTPEVLVPRVPVMYLFFSSMMYLIYGLTDVAIYTPLEISSGGTRRNVFLGTIFMCMLQIGVSLLFLLAFYGLVPKIMLPAIPMRRMLLATAAIGLFVCGTGMIMGQLVWRFGKVAYYVLIFIITGVCAVSGALFTMSNGGYVGVANRIMMYIDKGFVLILAVLWYALMAGISYLMLMKAEIRA
ncbi:MAG: hypothetical protein PUD20_07450 [bacterium]|nr:hypothetical protein [bacterium]